jgi:hypothetical protein
VRTAVGHWIRDDFDEGMGLMEPVKLLERAASGAVHAVRHPISSTAYAVGVVRGLAGAAVHGVTVGGHDPGQTREAGQPSQTNQAEDRAPTQATDQKHVVAQRTAPAVEQDVPAPEPTPLHESFATEPKAVSRESEHGGTGRDAEIDEWESMLPDDDEPDIETPVGTTGVGAGYNPDTAEAGLQQPGTELLLDPSTAKAIRSEAEMMQKAADPDKE